MIKLNVILIDSDENKVVVYGTDRMQMLKLVNKNGELKIRMPLTKMLSGDRYFKPLFIAKILMRLKPMKEELSDETLFKQTSFDVFAKEGSEIKIKLNVDNS